MYPGHPPTAVTETSPKQSHCPRASLFLLISPVPSRCVDISARRRKSIPQWTVEEEEGERKGNHNDREVMSSRRAKPPKPPPVVSELYKHADDEKRKNCILTPPSPYPPRGRGWHQQRQYNPFVLSLTLGPSLTRQAGGGRRKEEIARAVPKPEPPPPPSAAAARGRRNREKEGGIKRSSEKEGRGGRCAIFRAPSLPASGGFSGDAALLHVATVWVCRREVLGGDLELDVTGRVGFL